MLLTGAAILASAIWIYLVWFHGRFWRADQFLSAVTPARARWPEVVAVIPARNETGVIGETVSAHLESTYPGKFQVVVVDDHSQDGTAETVRTAARAHAKSPVAATVVPAQALPEGWSGKLWAVHQGIQDAMRRAPKAEYFLLTDADIKHGPEVLARLVTKAEGGKLAAVSLMAKLDARGPWAGLLIPAFVYFFQKLYPFPWVNDPASPAAGAAGGCMLVRRSALDAAGGIEAIRADLIDDCALARLLKEKSEEGRIWLGLTREVVSLRDNRQLGTIWNMVARTAYTQLRRSPLLLSGTVAGMALTYLAPPLLALTWPWHANAPAAALGAASWGLMTWSYAPTLRLYHRPAWTGLALPLAALLYTAMTVTSAKRHWQGRGGQWKGRVYPA
ncbi:MAG: glycosyltransferase [Alphaproteobacteria bacterium]